MPWQKGQSGNLKGRPSNIAVQDSLAGTIRRIFTREQREQAIAHLSQIASGAITTDLRLSIQAFEVLSRYGWPEEKSGAASLRIVGKNAQVLVQHVHLPIGVSGQSPDLAPVVDRPAYAGVKLGTARHIIDTAPVESPAPAAGSKRPDTPSGI
jgi:hypothetical protein